MEELEMIVGTRADLVCQVTIDEATLRVAEIMGVDVADIKECVCKEAFAEFETENEAAALTIAKQFGNTEEDLKKYGHKEPSSESETGRIEEEGQDLDDAVSRIAEAMGNSSEDIKRFGY